MPPGKLVPEDFLNDAREIAKIVLGSSRTRSSKFRRRRGGGGGGSTANLTKFAVVTVEAGASTHGSGGIALGSSGKCILLDDNGAKSSTATTDEIEFKSLHRVGIKVNTIIQLSAPQAIEPGSAWAANKVLGQFVDFVDYMFAMPTFGPKKSLGVEDGGTGPTHIKLLGGECSEP